MEWTNSSHLECGIWPMRFENFDVDCGLPHPESSYFSISMRNRETDKTITFDIPIETFSHILEHFISDFQMMASNAGWDQDHETE